MGFHSLYRQREAALKVREKYTSTVATVQADRDLSDEGRQRRIAEMYVKAQSELRDLGKTEAENLSTRRRTLERALFTSRGLDSATHAISARDAADRAAQLGSPEEASDLLARAEMDGDEVLVRAIARHCMRSSETALTPKATEQWEGVVGMFLKTRPALTTTVEELAEIETMSERQIFSPFSLPQPHGVDPAHFNRVGQENSAAPIGAGA